MKVELRKPTDDDIVRFRECLAADPDHASQSADDWLVGGEFMVFHDDKGNRAWVRIEKVLRVSMQHEPSRRAAVIINEGLRWVIGAARNSGFSEVVFESRAPRLIHFLQKLFGFERLKRQYSVRT